MHFGADNQTDQRNPNQQSPHHPIDTSARSLAAIPSIFVLSALCFLAACAPACMCSCLPAPKHAASHPITVYKCMHLSSHFPNNKCIPHAPSSFRKLHHIILRPPLRFSLLLPAPSRLPISKHPSSPQLSPPHLPKSSYAWHNITPGTPCSI